MIKADTDGSAEALRAALLQLPSDKVKLDGDPHRRRRRSTRATCSSPTRAGRSCRLPRAPRRAGRKAAEQLGVDVRVYQIIYEVIDEVRAAMAGLLAPTVKEVFLGRAEVRKTFTVPRVGTVAGSYVTEGLLRRGAHLRLLRDGVQVFEGRFASLKRFKDDVREVQQGFECGIGLEGFNDVKVGDVIEAFAARGEAGRALMVIGAARVELHVHASHSLKEKRGVIRSIVRRIRNEFNVAVAEVGGQDTWQWAVLGLAAVGHDRTSVRALLERVIDFVDGLHLAEVRDQSVEVLAGNLAEYGEDDDEDEGDEDDEDDDEDDEEDEDDDETGEEEP